MRAYIFNAMVTCYKHGESNEIDSGNCAGSNKNKRCEHYGGHGEGFVKCYVDQQDITISRAICDKCGATDQDVYNLRYTAGTRKQIGSTYCLGCAEERRTELL